VAKKSAAGLDLVLRNNSFHHFALLFITLYLLPLLFRDAEEIEDRGHTLDIIGNGVYNGTFLASKHVLVAMIGGKKLTEGA
jgi:hypothetical protein